MALKIIKSYNVCNKQAQSRPAMETAARKLIDPLLHSLDIF